MAEESSTIVDDWTDYRAWCDAQARARWALLGLNPAALSTEVHWDLSAELLDDDSDILAIIGRGGSTDAERRAILACAVAEHGTVNREFSEHDRHYVYGQVTSLDGETVVVGAISDDDDDADN